MKKLQRLIVLFFLGITSVSFAEPPVLNLYVWAGEIPETALDAFQKETGIKINFATYDSNEVLYAKLKATGNPGYDIVMPSSYYVDRMQREGMLEKLDKTKLPLLTNLDPQFSNPDYDPGIHFCVPFLWGTTGIFVNQKYYPKNSIQRWNDLWEQQFNDKLLLLDDIREIFSMALMSLGYSANDQQPEHIKEAYLKIQKILPNVKLFNNTAVASIVSDGDATVGMAWNGDIYKASQENADLEYIYPQEGFVIWVDNLSIPKNAPHRENAYKLLNFLMRPDMAKYTTLEQKYASTNLAAKKLLPEALQCNAFIYPSKEILKRGQFQTDISLEALDLYEKYWALLKVAS